MRTAIKKLLLFGLTLTATIILCVASTAIAVYFGGARWTLAFTYSTGATGGLIVVTVAVGQLVRTAKKYRAQVAKARGTDTLADGAI